MGRGIIIAFRKKMIQSSLLCFITTIAFIFLSITANSQFNDSIYRVPIGTDKVDTIRYDSTTAIKYVDYYVQGKILKRIVYFKDHKIQGVKTFNRIGVNIWSISWYSNGQMEVFCIYPNTKSWYENGQLWGETICQNDSGISTEYYKSGKIKEIRKVKDLGKEFGGHPYYIISYCENGQITSEDFLGKKYVYRSYYCNGKKMEICEKDTTGYFIGTYRQWNENGRLIVKGRFADTKHSVWLTGVEGGLGDKEGDWKYYNNKGKLIKIEIYMNGKLQYTEMPDGTRSGA